MEDQRTNNCHYTTTR